MDDQGRNQSVLSFVINNSNEEELRKKLFFARDFSPIFPYVENCGKYNVSHGEVLIVRNKKCTVIGVFNSRLWVQIQDNGDMGRLSYWDDIQDFQSYERMNIGHSNESVIRYTTHYELYTILYYTKKRLSLERAIYPYPIVPSIFENKTSVHNSLTVVDRDIISNIPEEMFLEIFNYCSPVDVFYSSLVSHKFYRILRSPSVWKRFCNEIGINFNETILSDDYDNNLVEYYFSHGVPRRMTLEINKFQDILCIRNNIFYLGGIYIKFTLKPGWLCLKICNSSLVTLNDIIVPVEICIINSSNVEPCKKIFKNLKKTEKLLNLSLFEPTILVITIKVSISLQSLMYRCSYNL